MNVWLAFTLVLLAILMVGAVGVPLIRRLTRLIGASFRNARDRDWQQEDVTKLLRRVAYLGSAVFLLSLLPWSFLAATVGGMADQYFRNTVNQWMSGPDLFQHLAIKEEEYYSQPLHWRQALAEIALREGDEDEALRQFISRLDIRQIELLELVAKHALGGALLGTRSAEGDPLEELSHMDLMHLEGIGVIDSVLPLNHKQIRPVTDAALESGTTVGEWLVGHQYGIFLSAVEGGEGTRVSFLVLTDTGKKLIDALRRPTSVNYLCWLQRYFGDRQLSAEIWSLREDDLEEHAYYPISEISGACESDYLTTQ